MRPVSTVIFEAVITGIKEDNGQTNVANSKGRSISVCDAMKVDGFINYRSIVSLYNKMKFVQFSADCFERLSYSSKIFAMDNIRYHYSRSASSFAISWTSNLLSSPMFSTT
ncbi:hypothetical protein RF11_07766 [Thelohanellus kitauei]|uniref:Tc1-like transposase DDE domain-containing protein n=1 Tax=Thelohanellus kitauei TaxID=669202 RepID=A0A0C2JSU7_THEKT|nr:hypothetical protein RF11_07766 [Thelohanellus kitauei]